MDSEEKALSLYSDFREKLVRKRTSCNTVLQFVHIFCKNHKNKTSICRTLKIVFSKRNHAMHLLKSKQ